LPCLTQQLPQSFERRIWNREQSQSCLWNFRLPLCYSGRLPKKVHIFFSNHLVKDLSPSTYLHEIAQFWVEVRKSWGLVEYEMSDSLEANPAEKVESLTVEQKMSFIVEEKISCSRNFSILKKYLILHFKIKLFATVTFVYSQICTNPISSFWK